MQPPAIMQASHRFLLLTTALGLFLAIVVADEPLTSADPTSPAGSQAPEPVAGFESTLPGRSEASGESEIASPLEPWTTEVPAVTVARAERSHTEEVNGDLVNSDASSLGSFSLDPLPGDMQSGPAMDVPAHSHESQESLDHEVDSEESLTSQDKSPMKSQFSEAASIASGRSKLGSSLVASFLLTLGVLTDDGQASPALGL